MKAEITLTYSGTGTVILDGTDVSAAVKGLSLVSDVGAANHPRLVLDLVIRDTMFAGEVLVDVPQRTRRALIAAGWTPPTEETP